MMSSHLLNTIQEDIKNNDIVLYMKGSADIPQCGFSAVVITILKNLNVTFKDINILADNEMRQAIKDFSNWPTLPQLYIKGEFIGGCDIVREMYETGELQDLLKQKGITV
jgi:monothiol glutaredoxin